MALSIGSNWVGFLPEDWNRVQSAKHYFEIKNRTMDNVQKIDNCINIPSSQIFRAEIMHRNGLLIAKSLTYISCYSHHVHWSIFKKGGIVLCFQNFLYIQSIRFYLNVMNNKNPSNVTAEKHAEISTSYIQNTPIRVVARSKAWTAFAHSNARI
jgi:hypothetical protein